MKKIYFLIILLFVSGCSTVNIPNYIKGENPYIQTVYADFDRTLAVTRQALDDSGWAIVNTTDPTVYEHSPLVDPKGKQLLLLTDIKDLPLLLGTRYARLNVFLRSTDQPNETEVEIRYLTVNSVMFKSFNNYKHPIAVEKIFNDIEKLLK